MYGIKECQTKWPEEKNGQPGGQGRGEVIAFAEILASELGREEESAQHQAHAGADEHVAVLIPQDDRDAHHHEDDAQEWPSQAHVKEDGHGGQSGGIGFAQLALKPSRGGELIPALAAGHHVEIDFLGVQEVLAGIDHLQNLGLIPFGELGRSGAGE